MAKKNKLMDNRKVRIALLSAAANLGILYLFTQTFDAPSYLIYMAVAFILGSVLFTKEKKLDDNQALILGGSISLAYNVGFFFFGKLNIVEMPLIIFMISAIQQAFITFVIGKVYKK